MDEVEKIAKEKLTMHYPQLGKNYFILDANEVKKNE